MLGSLAAVLLVPFAACAQEQAQARPQAEAQARTQIPPKPWDQAAVAKLAADLAKACVGMYDEYYDEQGVGGQSAIGSGDSVENYALRFKLRRIEEQAESLAGALAAGKGKVQTTHQVQDLGELADDLREILERMFVLIPLQQRVDAARAIWVQLLPYYGIAPPAAPPKKPS
jgi:hypothetical protein